MTVACGALWLSELEVYRTWQGVSGVSQRHADAESQNIQVLVNFRRHLKFIKGGFRVLHFWADAGRLGPRPFASVGCQLA